MILWSGEYHRLLWCFVNLGSGNGGVPSAITWGNADSGLCQYMVSLGHSELKLGGHLFR